MQLSLSRQIEAILFWKAEPVTLKKLASLLETDDKNIKEALAVLAKELEGRGITLVSTDEEVTLGTAKDMSPLIEKLTKDELTRDLGKAGLETISIILYKGPISRAEIDHIRGVSSQFIVRSLLIRGLIERVESPNDARSFLYKPTLDLLQHLGISDIKNLPEFENIRRDIDNFTNSNNEGK